MVNNRLFDFYINSCPGPRGLSLDEILSYDDIWWEKTHDFIQWIFPTFEPSAFNPDAPLLDTNTILAFRNCHEAQDNLERSLIRFMRFLRVDQSTPWWVCTSPHNYLRITRALDSVNTLSPDLAVPMMLYKQVYRIANANQTHLKTSLENYWAPVMER